jgi:hypothetical protein
MFACLISSSSTSRRQKGYFCRAIGFQGKVVFADVSLFDFVVRLLREFFDMWESHFCARVCWVMAIRLAGLGSC